MYDARQVVTDVRLWLREEIKDLQKHMRSLITSVVDRYVLLGSFPHDLNSDANRLHQG